MRNVKSLRAGVYAEIIIVIFPLALLLIYHSSSDIIASERLAEADRIRSVSAVAQERYKLFLSGVFDAVGSGKLPDDALQALHKATKELGKVTEGTWAAEFAKAAAKTEVLSTEVQKNTSLDAVLKQRAVINDVYAELAGLERRCNEASRKMIHESIRSAGVRKKVVSIALALGTIATAGLIFLLIRHINRFEEALRESEERMRVMFQSINAGIVLVDGEKRIVADVNPAALRMFGGTKEDMIGKVCCSLFYQENSNACPLSNEGKNIDISKGTLNRHDGRQMPILKSVNTVIINGRRYLLESFVDLSEQTALETELMSARDAAETASRAKSVFLASMSHEIRTPMNAILGYAHLLGQERNLSPQQVKHIEIINRSGEHLLKLINDILEMSKIEAGNINLCNNPFNFHNLLKDVESLFIARANHKRLRFTIDFIGFVPGVLNADEGKVRQVLINMISNALKFTEHGGIFVRVRGVRGNQKAEEAARDTTTITIDVEDTGSGIAAAEFDQVFASFEQTESGRHKYEGTGLGMPISRRFARLMGGDLVLVRSEPGNCSLFSFTFQAEVLGLASFQHPAERARQVRSIVPGEKEWRVLVIDDRETNRSLLSQVLTRVGFVVREADDGIRGLEEFREWRPDLVLMDIFMPKMDGYEATRRIKAMANGADTPIIAVTASVMMQEREKAREHGFDGFVMKPVQMHELFEEIRRVTTVDYLYEEPSLCAEQMEEMPLTPQAVSTLSRDVVSAMQQAIEVGDVVAIRALISRIGDSAPPIAAALRRLLDTHAYEELTTLFAAESAVTDTPLPRADTSGAADSSA